MRRFSLYQRGKIFYCRFWNPETQSYTHGLSTGESDRQAAMAAVYHWEKYGNSEKGQKIDDLLTIDTVLQGIRKSSIGIEDSKKIVAALIDKGLLSSAAFPSNKKENQFLIPFFELFWDYEHSPYVREKIAFGHSIGRRHCHEQMLRLVHWTVYFGKDASLSAITKEELRKFQMHLKEKGLAPKTINQITSVGTVAFRWLYERGELTSDPSVGLRKFAGQQTKRGILSEEETRKLFSVAWDDNRARIGNLLAMTTGARAGEILALRIEDICKDRIHIRHSWSRNDGLKKPKNGEERVVPIIPPVYKELETLIHHNPYGQDAHLFVFYGPDPFCPMSQNILRRGLQKALIDISLKADEQKDKKKRETVTDTFRKRGVCFHSWRHQFASRIAAKVELRKVQLATGHKSKAMAEYYAAHAFEKDFTDVASAISGIFNNVLPFDVGKRAEGKKIAI